MKPCAVLVAILAATSCGSPTAPTPPSAPPPAPAVLYTITGLVTVGVSTTPIAGATVSVVDGPNAGKSALTDGSGRYTIDGLTFAGFSIQAAAPNYLPNSRGVPLTAGVNPTTANLSLIPTAAWTQSGAGNTVFTMPNYFQSVRIQGAWNRTQTSNFIVRIGGRLVVNEILRDSITYAGVHLTQGGGTVEITNSSTIAWTFTEVR